MKQWRRLILGSTMAFVSAGLALALNAPEAQALPPASGPPAYVQVGSGLGSWPVKDAVNLMDRYTKTDLRFGTCRKGYKCIKIVAGGVRYPDVAWTSGVYWCCLSGGKGWFEHTIRVDVRDASRIREYGYYTKRWLLIHELGHTYGLGHVWSCNNAMYPRRRCNGHVPPIRWTASQLRVLARN